MFARVVILIALCCVPAASLVVGQETAGPSWRFRFPESNGAETSSQSQTDRIDVASLPPKPAYKKPSRIQVPSLADSQIVIPSEASSPSDNRELADRNFEDELQENEAAERIADARLAANGDQDPYAILPTAFRNQITNFGGTFSTWLPFRRTGRFWVNPDYLYWSAEGMRTPALVTSSPSGTPRDQAAFLGGPDTTVLFGQQDLNGGWQSGYRITAGFALDPNLRWQLEGDYLKIFDRNESFSAASDDQVAPTNILGRPFFDLINGRETAQLISYEDVVSGRISVNAESKLSSFGLYGRGATCPTPGPCDVIAINSPLSMQIGRFDVLFGYRYANLRDSLVFAEDLRSLDVANPGSFQIRESFQTKNEFNGIELGMAYHGRWNRFTTELVAKVAAGNNKQTVQIDGYSDIVEAGFLERFPGGVLAQRTNIGEYKRNELAVLPQLTFNLGARVTRYVTLRAGYSLFYLSNVVRAGDQIDTDLNPNLFPPEQMPLVDSVLRPEFEFRETDFWAHGANFGADIRF